MTGRARTAAYLAAATSASLGAPFASICATAAGLSAGSIGERLSVAWQSATSVHIVVGVVSVATSLVLGITLALDARRLERLTCLDPLTGLWNRRYFDVHIDREIARSTRSRLPLSLLVVDVDGLKRINELRGHLGGDHALVAVADSLRQSCRSSDIVARLGGDEFAVIAPGASADEARGLAERIRSSLRRLGSRRGLGPAVTISVGVADIDIACSRRASELMRAADGALYCAKGCGGDRLTVAARVANDLVRTPPVAETNSTPRSGTHQKGAVDAALVPRRKLAR